MNISFENNQKLIINWKSKSNTCNEVILQKRKKKVP